MQAALSFPETIYYSLIFKTEGIIQLMVCYARGRDLLLEILPESEKGMNQLSFSSDNISRRRAFLPGTGGDAFLQVILHGKMLSVSYSGLQLIPPFPLSLLLFLLPAASNLKRL